MKSCFVCKSDSVKAGFTAQTFFENDHSVEFEQVPNLVCPNCGEKYISTDVMRTLESVLNKIDAAEVCD